MNKLSYYNKNIFFLMGLLVLVLSGCTEKWDLLTPNYEPKEGEDNPGTGIFIDIDISSDAIGDIPDGYWSLIPEATTEFEDEIDPMIWSTTRAGGNAVAPVLYTRSNTAAVNGYLRQRTNVLVNDISTISDPATELWLGTGTLSTMSSLVEPGYYCEVAMRASEISMASKFELTDGVDTKISFQLIGEPTESDKADYNKILLVTTVGESREVEMDSLSFGGFQVYGVWWKDENNIAFYIDGQLVQEVVSTEALSAPLNLVVSSQYLPEYGLPTVDQINDLNKSMMYTDWIRTYMPEEAIVESNVKNASFETPDLADWTTSGTVEPSLYSTAVESGAYCAVLKGDASMSQMVEVEEGASHLFNFSGFAASGGGSISIDGAEDISIDNDPENLTISFSAIAPTVNLTISSSGASSVVYVDHIELNKEKPILIEGIVEGDGIIINDSLQLTLNQRDTMWASPDFGAAFVGWEDQETGEIVSTDLMFPYRLTEPVPKTFIAHFVDASTLPEPENLLAACDPGFEARDSIKDLGQEGWYTDNEVTSDAAWLVDGNQSYYHETGNCEVRLGFLQGYQALKDQTAYSLSFDYIADGDKSGTINWAWPAEAVRDFSIPAGDKVHLDVPFFFINHGALTGFRLFALWGQNGLSMDNIALREACNLNVTVVGGGDIENNDYPVAFGQEASITAVNGANSFARWEVNGKTISTDATLTFTAYSSYDITAVFE